MTPANAATPIYPYAIAFQFPSGEWSVESFPSAETARQAAVEAAREASGRVVHFMERKGSVVQPPNDVVWGA